MAKKLLDQMCDVIRLKHYSYRTEESYVDWARRFILFHHKRHPKDMGAPEIQAFLTHLAAERKVAASTHTCPGGRCQGNQALSAILFLYREVLHQEIEPILLSSAKRPERLPTVLTREEVLRVINQLGGTYKLMAQLLYGSGLRLMECLRLRIKDIDFEYKTITVRDGKGEKDRVTPLPDSVIPDLQRQIERARLLHDEDLAAGYGEVYLPYALEKKYPNAAREFIWQYLFPAPKRSLDPRALPSPPGSALSGVLREGAGGEGALRRHHLDPSGLQRAVKQAARKAGIQKRVSCHTFRHSFATHLLQNGYDTQHLRSGQVFVLSRNCSATKMCAPP